jgi:hypothetical protein
LTIKGSMLACLYTNHHTKADLEFLKEPTTWKQSKWDRLGLGKLSSLLL